MQNLKKMNKRGMLLPETLKILLAVICIVFLILLAIQLYSLGKSKTRIEQAKSNLDDLKIRISNLKEGENVDFLLISPAEYALTSWPLTAKDGTSFMPSQCSSKNWQNCICLCEYPIGADSISKDLLSSALENSNIVSLLLSSIEEIDKFINEIDPSKAVYEECEKFSVCAQIDKKTKVNSESLDSFDNLFDFAKFSRKQRIAVMQSRAERSILIRVDELIKFKKSLKVSLQNEEYLINVV